MRTNIEIDGELIARAQKLRKIKTKKEVLEKALRLFIQFKNQKQWVA